MTNIVVAFPKEEIARNIKKVLLQSGYQVESVCMTGAQALQSANRLDSGILVCGYRFVDMMCGEIREYLPAHFEMLLVASPTNCDELEQRDIVCLHTPLKVHELLQTVEMMDYSISRRRKREKAKPKVRSEEEKQMIQSAKELLMERNNFSEEEAHRYMQKRSMDNGTGLAETAQMILSLLNI